MIRDTQKEKLYRAEGVVWGKRFKDIHEVRAYVKKVTKAKWWQSHLGVDISDVEVGDGRRRRNACAFLDKEIRIPVFYRNELPILHELSHCVIYQQNRGYKVAHHGREFAKVLLEVVKRFMGQEEYLKLRASFKTHRVKYSVRRKTK